MELIPTKYTRGFTGTAIVALAMMLMSCANSRKSAQELTNATNMMQQIEEVEAMDYAGETFREAQVRLEEARQFSEQGKHRRAMLKAKEAMAAAELAEVQTLSKKAEESLRDLKTDIQSLKDELQTYTKDQ